VRAHLDAEALLALVQVLQPDLGNHRLRPLRAARRNERALELLELALLLRQLCAGPQHLRPRAARSAQCGVGMGDEGRGARLRAKALPFLGCARKDSHEVRRTQLRLGIRRVDGSLVAAPATAATRSSLLLL
jgi:hypothetical protein